MTYQEESYILDSLAKIKQEVHENNLMLRQICEVINVHLARYHQENEEDFGRNILANLISGSVDIRGFLGR